MRLPPFLQPLGTSSASESYSSAIFPHNEPIGAIHALWWPPCNQSPTTVLLFIPGNPGLLSFYIPFLSALHNRDASGGLAILAHSHIGHTPGVRQPDSSHIYRLPFQIQSALEAVDAIKSTYISETSVVIVSHSVGSWIGLQVMKHRPGLVSGIFLLFPAIAEIAKSPNGQRLSWLFQRPTRDIIITFSHLLRFLPLGPLLSSLFSSWPRKQLTVLEGFLRSPKSIQATLCMANDEMNTITKLDASLFGDGQSRIWIYFAKKDDWVGDQQEVIQEYISPESESIMVVYDNHDIPHAYCISHGEQLARQCHEWLLTLR